MVEAPPAAKMPNLAGANWIEKRLSFDPLLLSLHYKIPAAKYALPIATNLCIKASYKLVMTCYDLLLRLLRVLFNWRRYENQAKKIKAYSHDIAGRVVNG
jgi:hypothetical protein